MKKLFLFFSLIVLAAINARAQNDPGFTPGDTGTVTFPYGGSTITYVTVRAADGQIWLQQNLGSSQVAASLTDTAAYGHLFQWGRWDDGHQLRTSSTAAATTLSQNNPSGLGGGTSFFYTGNNPNDWWGNGSGTDSWTGSTASAVNGKDPCAAIGPDWHLPTETEWSNLLTMETISNTATAFSSNLKLPAAGMREPIFGNLLNVDLYGNYWAATASGPYAKDVTILNNGINPSDDALRSYGFSVRCLASCTGVLPPDTLMVPDTVCAGSIQTFSTAAVSNANSYIWGLPPGWSAIGGTTGTSLTVSVGSTGGTVTVAATNSCGPGTAISKNIVVSPLPVPVITAAGDVLSTGSFVSYQWLMNGQPIGGANNDSLTVLQSGSYQVIVTNASGCSDTSASYSITLGIEDTPAGGKYRLYPNPATSVVYIDAPADLRLVLYNADGKRVATLSGMKQLDTRGWQKGVYYLRISDAKGRLLETEKLVLISE